MLLLPRRPTHGLVSAPLVRVKAERKLQDEAVKNFIAWPKNSAPGSQPHTADGQAGAAAIGRDMDQRLIVETHSV